jgi:hypothetical protein
MKASERLVKLQGPVEVDSDSDSGSDDEEESFVEVQVEDPSVTPTRGDIEFDDEDDDLVASSGSYNTFLVLNPRLRSPEHDHKSRVPGSLRDIVEGAANKSFQHIKAVHFFLFSVLNSSEQTT